LGRTKTTDRPGKAAAANNARGLFSLSELLRILINDAAAPDRRIGARLANPGVRGTVSPI